MNWTKQDINMAWFMGFATGVAVTTTLAMVF